MKKKKAQLHKVFVYGTLRPGMERNRANVKEPLPATHKLRGYGLFFYEFGRYPYLKPVKGKAVHGNLILVNDRDLAYLDYIEGVQDNMFKREELIVVDEHGAKEKAFVYTLAGLKDGDPTVDRAIPGGDWLKFQTRRQSRR